jgi:hypothetical protein
LLGEVYTINVTTMGQICSGQKGEQSKDSALSADITTEDLTILKQQQEQYQQQIPTTNDFSSLQNQSSASSLTALQQQQTGASGTIPTASSAKEKERLKALQQEQHRLDMIVAAAGRGMISVRSTRGSTGYYDQGFAAALAQHLEQTTSFPSSLPVTLPLAPNESRTSTTNQETLKSGDGDQATKLSISYSNTVYDRLARPQWEGIALGQGGGLAGCGGENPSQYIDNVAEALLDTVLPTKQHLFAGVKPMVENLL